MQTLDIRFDHKVAVGFYSGFAADSGNETETAGVEIHIGFIADGLDHFHGALKGFTRGVLAGDLEIFRSNADNDLFVCW